MADALYYLTLVSGLVIFGTLIGGTGGCALALAVLGLCLHRGIDG